MAKKSQAREVEEDIVRAFRLFEAFDVTGVVSIDGILIDMTCDVDKGIWRPVNPLGSYSAPSGLRAPEIVFPWTPSKWRRHLAKGGDLVEAKAGSRITVDHVVSVKLDAPLDEFSHAENQEAKLVYLSVKDGEQSIRKVNHPLVLLARGATAHLVSVGDYSSAFGSIVHKLEQAIGLDDLEDLVEKPISKWPTLRRDISRTFRLALIAFIEASRKMNEEAFVAFGYMMARAEAEKLLLNSAIRGRAAISYQLKAASGRHAKSRRETEPLRAIARQIIGTNNNISLTKCARAVAEQIARQQDWTLGSDPKWVARHIKELFEQRKIGREYRPKRGAK